MIKLKQVKKVFSPVRTDVHVMASRAVAYSELVRAFQPEPEEQETIERLVEMLMRASVCLAAAVDAIDKLAVEEKAEGDDVG